MMDDIKGEERNSEHEFDEAGMRRSARKGTGQSDKERARQGTLENLSQKRGERDVKPAPDNRRARLHDEDDADGETDRGESREE